MQLVSESVKAKHLHSTLLSEKQAFADQLQKINSLIENSKKRITNSEEQVLFPLLLSPLLICLILLNNCAAARYFKKLFELSRSNAFYQKLLNVLKMKNTSQPP
jgi:hypothetical protein